VHWLTDPFEPAFMQRAALGGLLVVVVCSLVGSWMVLRGLSFLGDALAHGVLPGIAVAFLIGANLVAGAAVSALVMVGGVGLVARRSRLPADAGIGLLFVGMLALGVVIISRSGSFAVDLTSLLFGDVLATSRGDLTFLLVAAAVVAAVSAVFYRPFLVLALDARKAATLGLAPGVAQAVTMLLVAFAVVASFRVVGTLLVFAMLVAPPSTATLIARRVPVVMGLAVVFGSLAVVIGLVVSWHADTAASATIALAAVAEFFVTLLVREISAARPRAAAR
jgi:ABC-type Mn2+/Zn2+ transport system permease subunit